MGVQKQMDVVLSPQWLVSCDTGNMGCNGGMLSAAWSYMESHGIPTLACDPYVSGQGDSHSGECNITYNPDTCDEETMYKATNIGGFTSAQISRWKSCAEAQLRLDSPSTPISTPTRPESTPTPTDKSSVDMPSRSSDGDKRKTEPTTGSSLTVGAQAGECLD